MYAIPLENNIRSTKEHIYMCTQLYYVFPGAHGAWISGGGLAVNMDMWKTRMQILCKFVFSSYNLILWNLICDEVFLFLFICFIRGYHSSWNVIDYMLGHFLLQKWKQKNPSRLCANLCFPDIVLYYETSSWWRSLIFMYNKADISPFWYVISNLGLKH